MAHYTTDNTDELSHVLPLVEIVNQETTIGLVVFYDSATEERPECLNEFFAITSVKSTVDFKTIGEFVIERNTFSIPDINDVLFAGSVVGQNYDEIQTGVRLIHDTFYSKLPDLYSTVPAEVLEYISIGWQPIPEMWKEASQRVNPVGNTLGFDLPEGFHIAWVGIVMWNASRYDAAVGDWVTLVTDAIDDAAKAQGVYHPFKYMNDAAGSQPVFAGYGAENRERLLNISREYDPDRVFQELSPGGFKIGF